MIRALFLAIGVLLALPSAGLAVNLELSGNFTQGGLVYGRAAPGAEVEFLGRKVRVGGDGGFVFGFGRDFPGTGQLTVRWPDGRREVQQIDVAARSYKIQKIDGLPERMVTPPAEVLARIRRENAAIARARDHDGADALFRSGFVWPVIGRVSGVFGSQRVLNGKPRRPHFGVDIAAPPGTPVHAPADGVVVMAEPDLYYTGGTVMLDHGHGLVSVYSHLKDVSAKVGARLRQGEVIGTLGATGRATGPHLDWRINWFDQRLDPALLVGPMPDAGTR
jgi:hypothetical protein